MLVAQNSFCVLAVDMLLRLPLLLPLVLPLPLILIMLLRVPHPSRSKREGWAAFDLAFSQISNLKFAILPAAGPPGLASRSYD
jgi:hypothetical protein